MRMKHASKKPDLFHSEAMDYNYLGFREHIENLNRIGKIEVRVIFTRYDVDRIRLRQLGVVRPGRPKREIYKSVRGRFYVDGNLINDFPIDAREIYEAYYKDEEDRKPDNIPNGSMLVYIWSRVFSFAAIPDD
jgi:hypothetical protein